MAPHRLCSCENNFSPFFISSTWNAIVPIVQIYSFTLLIEEMFVRAAAKFGFSRCQEIWTKKINKKLWSTSGAWKTEKKKSSLSFVLLSLSPISLSLFLSRCHLSQSIVSQELTLSPSLVLILRTDNANFIKGIAYLALLVVPRKRTDVIEAYCCCLNQLSKCWT